MTTTLVTDVPSGTVVRWKGEWGVLQYGGHLYRWNGPPIQLKAWEIVSVPTPRTFRLTSKEAQCLR